MSMDQRREFKPLSDWRKDKRTMRNFGYDFGYDLGVSQGYREGRILATLEMLIGVTLRHEREHPSDYGDIDLVDYLMSEAKIYWEEAHETIIKYQHFDRKHLAKKIFFEGTYLPPKELFDYDRMGEDNQNGKNQEQEK